MNQLSDDHLVKSCLQGCQEHCKLLYERYKRLVFSLTYSYYKDKELARDLRQETFLKAFKGLRKFRGDASFKNWLSTIAVNLCKDNQNRQMRERLNKESLDAAMDHNDEDSPKRDFPDDPEKRDPSLLYEKAEQKALIGEALKRMDQVSRQIVLLWADGMTQKEISEIVKLPQGTVGRETSDAKALIRSIIAQKKKRGSKK